MTEHIPLIGMALLLFLPGVFLLALYFCRDVNIARFPIVLLFSASFLLTLTHLAGLLTKKFYLSLFLVTIMLGLLGYIIFFVKKPKTNFGAYKRSTLYFCLLLTLFIVPMVFLYDFHDKIVSLFGHFYTNEQILNDVYPPTQTHDPTKQLTYHYGMNTLSAMVATFLHVPSPIAMDILTVLFWFLLALLFVDFYRVLLKKEKFYYPVLPLLAGGIPWLVTMLQPDHSPSQHLMGLYTVGETLLNPPFISYFFQHAWTIGTPLAIALIILIFFDQPIPRKNFFVIFILSVTLGISNTTLFITLIPSILLIYFLSTIKKHGQIRKSSLIVCGVLIISIFLSLAISGFSPLLKSAVGRGASIVFTSTGITGSGFVPNLFWNIASFGLLIFFGLLGFRNLKDYKSLRYVFLLMIIVCLIIFNNFRYVWTWDVVKFATVVQILLAILSGLYLYSLQETWIKHAFIAALILPGVTFNIPFLLGMKDNPFEPAFFRHPRITMCESERDVILWLRQHNKDNAIPLRSYPANFCYATLGGMNQFFLDIYVKRAFQISDDEYAHRQELYHNLPKTADFYKTNRIGWFVIDEEDSEDPFRGKVNDLLQKKIIIEAEDFGRYKLFRVLP